MFDFTSKTNLGKTYNGFILLSIDDLCDYNAKGVFLRHKKTDSKFIILSKMIKKICLPSHSEHFPKIPKVQRTSWNIPHFVAVKNIR